MNRTLLAVILGAFSFFAFFFGGEFFEAKGKPAQEIVAGCIALLLYMALCQFLLPRDPSAGAAEDWRVRACMVASLASFALLIVVTNPPGAGLGQTVPMLAAGCIGSILGGLLARASTLASQPDAARAAATSKLLANIGAALYVAVSAILFALVVPAILRDTSPNATPRSAGRGMMVCAVLHVIFGASMLWRAYKGKVPVLPASFGFLMTVLLAGIGAAYMTLGASMRLASIALFVCAALDMAVCGCCVGVAIQRRDAPVPVE